MKMRVEEKGKRKKELGTGRAGGSGKRKSVNRQKGRNEKLK
jgi:hypothetical protein